MRERIGLQLRGCYTEVYDPDPERWVRGLLIQCSGIISSVTGMGGEEQMVRGNWVSQEVVVVKGSMGTERILWWQAIQ